jgi:integrase
MGPALETPIASLSSDSVAELCGRMEVAAPVHARRALAYAAPFFAWAVASGLVATNTTALLPRPRPEERRERVLSLDEVQRLWAVTADIGRPFGPAVQILILTAALRGDVAAMRISELRRESDGSLTWLPVARQGPEGATFAVPLPAPADTVVTDALSHRVPGSDLIFSTTGATPISGWSGAKRHLDARLTDAARGAMHQSWRLNDLRASFAILSRDVLGTDPLVVERCLGRITNFSSPLDREWAISEAMRHKHRIALERWAELVRG